MSSPSPRWRERLFLVLCCDAAFHLSCYHWRVRDLLSFVFHHLLLKRFAIEEAGRGLLLLAGIHSLWRWPNAERFKTIGNKGKVIVFNGRNCRIRKISSNLLLKMVQEIRLDLNRRRMSSNQQRRMPPPLPNPIPNRSMIGRDNARSTMTNNRTTKLLIKRQREF